MTRQQQRLIADAERIMRTLVDHDDDATVWGDMRDWLKAHAKTKRATTTRKDRS